MQARSAAGRPAASAAARLSDYGLQLREKQKLRRIYGILERQFRTLLQEGRPAVKGVDRREPASSCSSVALDNVVYRMGFGATRAEARQLVSHSAVHGERQDRQHPVVPGRAGDVVEPVREGARSRCRIQQRADIAGQSGFPDWVEVDAEKHEGVFKAVPDA